MIIGNKKVPNFNLNIDGIEIERVETFRYLGILIDSKLKFNKHLNEVCGKLSKLAGISFKISPSLDFISAKNFYFSFVYSLISYGIEAWGGALLLFTTDRLQKLQDRIVNNLFKRHIKFNNINGLYKKLNLLKSKEIYLYVSLKFVHNIKYNPNFTVNDTFKLTTKNNIHHLRNTNELEVPNPKNNTHLIGHTYQFPKNWNELPNTLKECVNLNKFLQGLKTHLLNKYD